MKFIEERKVSKLSDIVKAHPEYAEPTIKKDLAYLLVEKEIEKIGEFKGTIYKIKVKE